MTPERWQKIKGILGQCLDLQEDERGLFLAKACAGDIDLQNEVESLLACEERQETEFLSHLIVEHVPEITSESAPENRVGQHIGPYELVREIGSGGMGSVYLAMRTDDFHKQVAIKLVQRGLASDFVVKRFRQERQTLAALNHPNIIRLLDGGTTPDGLPYLVTEYVRGTPLVEFCARQRLSVSDRLRLFLKICHAVQYAHDHGVIHRDLKPSNILVSADGEPMLLDFGIAKLLNPEWYPASMTITRADMHPMTPAYASPEQVRGEELTPASDVFSLGVVLYEILTGKPPHDLQSQSRFAIERIICEVDPEKPSYKVRKHSHPQAAQTCVKSADPNSQAQAESAERLHRELAGDLDSIILKALRKDTRQRYGSVRELADDIVRHLENRPVLAHEGAFLYSAIKLVRRRKTESAAALVIVAVVVCSIAGKRWQARRTIPSRPSVAVLGFRNISGDPNTEWLSTALAEMLTTELSAGGKVLTIPGETVSQMKANLALAPADSYGRETLRRIRANLGSDNIVLGSYFPLGNGKIRLDLRLEDASNGQIIDSLTQNGTQTDISEMVSRIGSSLREKLGVGAVTSSEAAQLERMLPSNPEAARLFSEGLERLRQSDSLAARERFERAIAIEPDCALLHIELAAAWKSLGYDAKALREAKVAYEMASGLEQQQRWWIEGQYWEIAHKWDQATEIYEHLVKQYPDNLEYGLRLADVQTANGKANDVLATVAGLRRLREPASADPRIDLAEAAAAQAMGDYRREQAVAATAATKSQERGARLLEARARQSEGWAWEHLGHLNEAMDALAQAGAVYESLGDQGRVAATLNMKAAVLADKGELEAAKQMYLESLKMARTLGYKLSEAHTLNNVGIVQWRQGQLAAAKRTYGQSLAVYREIENKEGEALIPGNIGLVLSDEGDLGAAALQFQESLTRYRQLGNRNAEGRLLNNLGNVFLNQGALGKALAAYNQALTLARETGHKHDATYPLIGLAQLAMARGDLVEARKRYSEVLNLQEEIGEKGSAAETRVGLAELALEEGHPGEAESLVRSASQEFSREGLLDDEIDADRVLARAFFAQRRPTEGQQEIESARKLLAKSQNRFLRARVSIVAARAAAQAGHVTQACAELDAVRAELARSGYVGLQFESRLALDEIEWKIKGNASARARLETLEREAREKGFGLIADSAAHLLRPAS